MDLEDVPNYSLLRISLQCAVPLWIAQFISTDLDDVMALGRECGQVVAERGDILQFRSRKRGETAGVFNALAKGLAAMAFAPGGVTFLGDQYVAEHPQGVLQWDVPFTDIAWYGMVPRGSHPRPCLRSGKASIDLEFCGCAFHQPEREAAYGVTRFIGGAWGRTL